MNPWSSPWEETAPSADALHGVPRGDVHEERVQSVPEPDDPWGQLQAEHLRLAPRAPRLDLPAPTPAFSAMTLDPGVAQLTTEAVAIEDNVWGDGNTVATRTWAAAEAEAAGTGTGTETAEAEAEAEAAEAAEAAEDTAAAQGDARSEAYPVSDPPRDATSLPAPPADSGPSKLARLSAAVASWRKPRPTPKEEKEIAARAQGWRQVESPKPTSSSLSGWLSQRNTSTSEPQPTPAMPASLHGTEHNAAVDPWLQGAPTTLPVQNTAAVLSASDLSWLDAASAPQRADPVVEGRYPGAYTSTVADEALDYTKGQPTLFAYDEYAVEEQAAADAPQAYHYATYQDEGTETVGKMHDVPARPRILAGPAAKRTPSAMAPQRRTTQPPPPPPPAALDLDRLDALRPRPAVKPKPLAPPPPPASKVLNRALGNARNVRVAPAGPPLTNTAPLHPAPAKASATRGTANGNGKLTEADLHFFEGL